MSIPTDALDAGAGSPAPTGGRQRAEQRSLALALALAVYVVLLAAKLAAYASTGVLVVLAEALHTVSDIIIAGFLLLALHLSRRPPDERHPYGYGRAQAAAGLVAATLFISFTALRLYEEAIPRLFDPPTPPDDVTVALWVLGGSMLVVAAPLVRLARQPVRGPAAKALLWELINDELGLAAALVGTLLAVAGFGIADPLAAVTVATIIAVKAVSLFRENLCFLLGRAPDPAVLERIRTIALGVPGVEGLHELRAEYIAPDLLFTTMHLDLDPGRSVGEAETISREVRERVHREIPAGFCVTQTNPAPQPSRAGSR